MVFVETRDPGTTVTRTPELSIVVPTCGRPGALRRLLRALSQQHGSHAFEVVVVADGVRAASTGVGDTRAWPFAVRVEEQPRTGAATARNRGALLARAPVLLFLDDDVEPSAAVVSAHFDFHGRGEARIGIGELAPHATARGYVGSALCGWWELMNDGLADARHRFTFRDLLTGHCSMQKATFEALGGFDPSLRCQEDFDFGYRAIEGGIDLRFVREARAIHHDESNLDKILTRKFDEGIANVQLCEKHPRLLRALPLGRTLADARFAQAVQRSALRAPSLNWWIPAVLRSAMAAFEALSMRDKWRESLERLMDYWYWRGVAHAAGGAAAVARIRDSQDPHPEPPLEVELIRGLASAERQIQDARPRSLRIVLGGELVGELPDVPGAERLRGLNLRPLLLKGMPDDFIAAAHAAGLLPEAFASCVKEDASAGARPRAGAHQAA